MAFHCFKEKHKSPGIQSVIAIADKIVNIFFKDSTKKLFTLWKMEILSAADTSWANAPHETT